MKSKCTRCGSQGGGWDTCRPIAASLVENVVLGKQTSLTSFEEF